MIEYRVYYIDTKYIINKNLIGFLGYLHSPKWFKNFKNKNVYQLNSFNNTSPPAAIIRKTVSGIRLFHTYSPLRYDEGASDSYTCKSHLQHCVPRAEGKAAFTNSNILINFFKEKNLNPVFCYEDLHLETTKIKVKNETENLSGIYLILNKITLDYYIGSASTNKLYSRFYRHLYNFTGSKIVKLAVKKYKLSNFAFCILELFPEIVNKENNKQLLDLEDFYLKSLLPNYNILTEAGSSFGYKHTEIDRIKMKANYSLERRLRIGNLNKGKILSEITKQKIREKALKRPVPVYSEQAVLNMKKRSKSIILYNLDKTVYGEYSSITEAAKSINCFDKTIRRTLKTSSAKKILKKRWIVKYTD